MNAILTIADRLSLSTVLPKRGSYEDMIVREDIRNKVKFTQKELKKYEIKQFPESGMLEWKETVDNFDYEFTELEEALIIKSLTELSKKNELGVEHVGLYKKFVTKTMESQEKKKKK